MYKPYWGWAFGCSKHVEDNVTELNHWWKTRAFCWFLFHTDIFYLIKMSKFRQMWLLGSWKYNLLQIFGQKILVPHIQWFLQITFLFFNNINKHTQNRHLDQFFQNKYTLVQATNFALNTWTIDLTCRQQFLFYCIGQPGTRFLSMEVFLGTSTILFPFPPISYLADIYL